ncbi:MalY/PatB family protein [Streptomyces sp. NPDC046942]|uniref:MalY/PatB family protein n=1 Tax=Streptomyces sp. NPDC046942 TaxID=3155137 RepID=UPI0033F22EEE
MRPDFSEPTDRHGTNSLKWDVAEDELPMWVADMDFRTAPAVVEAIQAKARTGIFGYTTVPDAYVQAVAAWWERHHAFPLEQDWIIFCTGVVPAISSIVRKMTTVGENVLIQPPVYNIFYNSIVNNGRNVLRNELLYDGTNYQIDFDDLERKLADPQTTLMILCNPHNPIGKIWDKPILARIGDLCARHHVLVVSDEIHCDLTDPGHSYTPFASVSDACRDNSITCVAPTKAFNLAGLQTASAVIPNRRIRAKVNRGLNTDEVAEPNAFAIEATIAAFTQGKPWLDALRSYIHDNKQQATEFIRAEIPGLKVVPSQATYLLWIDCAAITSDTADLCRFLRQKQGLLLSEGGLYGGDGTRFVRMNVACPRARLEDGLARLRAGVQAFRSAGRGR